MNISKLMVSQRQFNHATMTKQSHLGEAMMIRPDKLFPEVMDRIFMSQDYYSENPLTSTLSGLSKGIKTINGTAWEWQLKTANTRPLIVLENVEPSSNLTVGKYNRPFKLKVDENFWLPGDYVSPGNPEYQCRVVSAGVPHGEKGTVYELIIAGDKDKYILPKFLETNAKWGKLYSKYGEATNQSGSTTYGLPVSFMNSISKLRKHYKVTDYASTEVLDIAMVDSKGQVTRSWVRYAEVEFYMQWYKEKERNLWYSTKNNSLYDDNGEPIVSGAGIYQMLEDSHVYKYNTLSASLLEQYLMDIFFGRVTPGSRKQVVGYAGEYGILNFDTAISNFAEKRGITKNVVEVAPKTTSSLNSNALNYGYQYTEYTMRNGLSMKLIHDPTRDDLEINNELDERTGKPKFSQRISFLDFAGEMGKEPNVQIVKKNKGESFGYVEGMYGPLGPNAGGSKAHAGDYYEMHVGCNENAHITDVSKCGELILN